MAIAAGMIGAGVVSGLIGASQASAQREQAQQQLEKYQAGLAGVRVPTVEEQQIQLRDYVNAGIISPEQEQAILQDPSAMLQVTTDPRLKQAQMQALQGLQTVSQQGFSPVEQAAMAKIQAQVAQQDTARRQAILQNMAQRGIAGSGIELAAQLQGAQQAAQLQSQQGLDVAAQAQQRALQALSQAGTLGGQMESQQFGEASAKAQAADAIAQFNAQQRAAAQQRNIEAQRQAQYYNVGQQQRISDLNTQLRNQQEMYNKALIQQQYQNQLGKQAAMGGVATQLAGVNMLGAQQAAQQWANIGGGVSQGLGAYGQMSQQQAQTDAYNRRTAAGQARPNEVA